MQTYVTLWKYTKDGLMDIKKTPKRFEFVKKVINSAGGKLLSIYGLVGEYDVVTVMEMPDEKAAAATILKICSTGRITSQTMIALSLDDFLKIAKEV
ncbi:MAG: GYD domain-containing protein [Deltaproteobacteria bacterium]|nr:GYD domain-containing protein [Deltaproteobacteria bacterium]